jgi:hypothetical protein
MLLLGVLGVLYVAHALGVSPQPAMADGTVTDGGRSRACGPLADHAAAVLQAGGVSCKALSRREEYHQAMAVKLLWSSIFWLVSAGLGGVTVSNAGLKYDV